MAIKPVYKSSFYVTISIRQFLFAGVSPVYTRIFLCDKKDWKLGSTDDIQIVINFMCCRVYSDRFLYVTTFICHRKTNTPFSSKNFVVQILVNFVRLHEQIKIVK